MNIELTEAEKAFDDFIRSRREQGRKTYGQGLDHRDTRWNWERMALEELADACQYLIAETKRLRNALDEAHTGQPDDLMWEDTRGSYHYEQVAHVGQWICAVHPCCQSQTWKWELIDRNTDEIFDSGVQVLEAESKAVVVALARLKREEAP